jgi:hypothetical protein
MAHKYTTINTGQKEYRDDVLITGFMPLTGTLADLSISAGYIDGREVLADTSVSVQVGNTDEYSGFLISEDGAGAFVVTDTTLDTYTTAALALAAAKALDVPTGDTALFVGVCFVLTAVGQLKDDSVKGRVLGDDIAADETITL